MESERRFSHFIPAARAISGAAQAQHDIMNYDYVTESAGQPDMMFVIRDRVDRQ